MQKTSRERGLLLIVCAIGAALLLGLCALVIGLGLYLSNATRIRNITNAAALAAIEKWVSLGVYQSLTYDDKIPQVLERVNLILQKNYVPGFKDPSLHIGKVYLEGQEEPDSAGVLRPGRMYPRPPGDATDPCGGNYPCLRYYPGGAAVGSNSVVNAFQLVLRTRQDNPLIVPFAAIFGQETFGLGATATATLVERCTAFLLDISLSVYAETHQIATPAWVNNFPERVLAPPGVTVTAPYKFVINPPAQPNSDDFPLVSSPVFKLWPVYPMSCSDPGNFDVSHPNFLANLIWCNMPESRTFGGTLTNGNSNPPEFGPGVMRPVTNSFPWDGVNNIRVDLDGDGVADRNIDPYPSLSGATPASEYIRHHFHDDYRLQRLYDGSSMRYESYIDGIYKGPEPFTSHLKSINVALQSLINQKTAFDLATLKVFSGYLRNEIPPFFDGSNPPAQIPAGFTSDLNYLLQITDARNVGLKSWNSSGGTVIVSPTIHPNFLDHGWYTFIGDAPEEKTSTNLVEILDHTIAQMQFCPQDSKKQIIFITDGISDCSYITHDNLGQRKPNAHIVPDPDRVCNASYSNYIVSERQLLGGTTGQPYQRPVTMNGSPYPSILERLIDSEIALTVILNGANVEPNFKNVADPNPGCADPNRCTYLDFLKAAALGLGGFGYPPNPESCGLPNGSCDFFDYHSTCPGYEGTPECDYRAWRKAGFGGNVFRRPNAVLGLMTMRSGGLWCPLMPQADPSWYAPDGYMLAQYREPPGSTQTYSVLNIPKSVFAANCAAAAVGHNPFILNEPLMTQAFPP